MPFSVGRQANFGKCSIFSPTVSVLRKHLLIGQSVFFTVFMAHHLGRTYTGTDQNEPYYRFGIDCVGRA